MIGVGGELAGILAGTGAAGVLVGPMIGIIGHGAVGAGLTTIMGGAIPGVFLITTTDFTTIGTAEATTIILIISIGRYTRRVPMSLTIHTVARVSVM